MAAQSKVSLKHMLYLQFKGSSRRAQSSQKHIPLINNQSCTYYPGQYISIIQCETTIVYCVIHKLYYEIRIK